jgi:hypothetical protein
MSVSFSGWVSESISTIQNGDRSLPARLLRPLYLLYEGAFLTVTSRYPIGTNVFDLDWDALIILDACQVDALAELAPEYEFLSRVDSIQSVGSSSFEWMDQTFSTAYRDEIAETAYVTQNQFHDRILGKGGTTGQAILPIGPSRFDVVDPSDFGYLEGLWRAGFEDDSEWVVQSEVTTRVHPRYTTDRAIRAGRTIDCERMMVHYMYPHDPYVLADPKLQPRFDAALKSGSATRAEVWNAYLDNLRFVLDEVALLLENLDRDEVVISADHGEAFGEYGFYRHPPACPIPSVRRVPWANADASDERTYESRAPAPERTGDASTVEDRLEQLGYL